MDNIHKPVMLNEVLEYLNVQKNKWYIDCNLGGGGHTKVILQKEGKVLGIDLDSESIKLVANKYNLSVQEVNGSLQAFSDNLILVQANFANLKKVIENLPKNPNTQNLPNFSGILFDLGLSSNQLEDPIRGFSFNKNAPLDMRMGDAFAVRASDLLNALSKKELTELFFKLGEEPFSKRIAKEIVEYRKQKKIETTYQLADITLKIIHKKPGQIHPATRIFQALRIAVNDELNNLKEALPQALEILQPGGRLVVISFHSLEDRIVKNFIRDHEDNNLLKSLTKKPLTPTEEEINLNPRSRSAKMRVAEKI